MVLKNLFATSSLSSAWPGNSRQECGHTRLNALTLIKNSPQWSTTAIGVQQVCLQGWGQQLKDEFEISGLMESRLTKWGQLDWPRISLSLHFHLVLPGQTVPSLDGLSRKWKNVTSINICSTSQWAAQRWYCWVSWEGTSFLYPARGHVTRWTGPGSWPWVQSAGMTPN